MSEQDHNNGTGVGHGRDPLRLLKVPDVMEALRIGRSSVYRLFASGDLRWVQVGAQRRVSEAEIQRFIAAHTEMAATPTEMAS